MMQARPGVTAERWLLLATRYPAHREAKPVIDGCGGWRTVGFLTRCGLAVLGLIAAIAAAGLLVLMFREHTLIPAGLLLWVAGEILIREWRWFASGLEEVLVIAGLSVLALGAVDGLHAWDDEVIIAWMMAGAWLLAGLRLLNPLCTTLAVLLAAHALHGLARVSDQPAASVQPHDWAGWCCYAVALLALALGQRRWLRPAHDRMCDWLVVSMPVASYLYLLASQFQSFAGPQTTQPSWITVLALSGFAILAIVVALRRRTHAPLLGAIACAVCVAYELRNLSGMPLSARLILWGGMLLLASHSVERYLRTPRAGITSGPVAGHEDEFMAAEIGTAAVTSPPSSASVAMPGDTSPVQGQGGRFGGGGASGGY